MWWGIINWPLPLSVFIQLLPSPSSCSSTWSLSSAGASLSDPQILRWGPPLNSPTGVTIPLHLTYIIRPFTIPYRVLLPRDGTLLPREALLPVRALGVDWAGSGPQSLPSTFLFSYLFPGVCGSPSSSMSLMCYVNVCPSQLYCHFLSSSSTGFSPVYFHSSLLAILYSQRIYL